MYKLIIKVINQVFKKIKQKIKQIFIKFLVMILAIIIPIFTVFAIYSSAMQQEINIPGEQLKDNKITNMQDAINCFLELQTPFSGSNFWVIQGSLRSECKALAGTEAGTELIKQGIEDSLKQEIQGLLKQEIQGSLKQEIQGSLRSECKALVETKTEAETELAESEKMEIFELIYKILFKKIKFTMELPDLPIVKTLKKIPEDKLNFFIFYLEKAKEQKMTSKESQKTEPCYQIHTKEQRIIFQTLLNSCFFSRETPKDLIIHEFF
ncbi:MAG: hypothetical protein LBJ32_00570 [Oscillospiraceae bacterium]|jgi:hypothetical protein|nr:hypothetical protein [Oscillospiraceae bacterium]